MKASKLALLFAFLLVTPDARSAALDPNFTQTELPGASLAVTGMAWAPDGSHRLFLTTKDGTTRIIEDGVLLPAPFMSVPGLYLGSECGLLSLAFDPNFGENGYVYFFMTVSVSEQRIVRYRAVGNDGVEPTVIVQGLPTRGANHDGGALAFGPDGKLYWAIGDLGGGIGINDDLASLASKVGRVNRDGSVPSDNPFHDGEGPNDDRIWARGFRNPFTLAFRPSTADLWLNVVGASFEQVFVIGAGDHGGWSTYETWQPKGFRDPVIAYQTNGASTYAVSATQGAVRTGNVTTFTTSARHRFRPGEQITVTSVDDTSFNGTAFVVEAPSETTVTIEQVGPDATSNNGTIAAPYLGGCITGGVFYDSTAASPAYRGDFFFGDLNSGIAARAHLDGSVVRSVQPWADGHVYAVDMSLGPDGDLYLATYGGAGPQRYAFRATSQYLVVSPTNLWMLEDGVAAFNVRLSMAPTSTATVRIRLPSASSTLSVTEGAALTFGPDDWSVPKPVRIAAARDDNTVDDLIDLTVATSGMPLETVRVRVTDEYEALEPPPGGAGGEAGAAGAAGDGGVAGEGTGEAGGESGGTGPGRDGGVPRGGSGAEGGQADGGQGNPSDTSPGDDSDDGCGCSMSKRSGGGLAFLVAALAFLRRRTLRLARGA
jgi:MYXO-CTERM domain-containing protein